MERTLPRTETEEIELYGRTYYSLLRSTAEVRIRSLEEVHGGMKSLLHAGARSATPDIPALIYTLLRLPDCILDTQLVVMGQSPDVFSRAGYGDITAWEEVSAPARRRRSYYDGGSILACLIASRSDIDDLIPLLTAFQIEWNKLHTLLRRLPESISLENYLELAEFMEVPGEDLDRLYAVLGYQLEALLEGAAAAPCNLRIRLLSGTLSEYRRATHAWWDHIEASAPELDQRPVYFVSSNTHSLVNVLSGFAARFAGEMIDYLKHTGNRALLSEWQDIQEGRADSSRENFLYYLQKKFLQSPQGRQLAGSQVEYERQAGILRIPSPRSFDVEAQVIHLARLDPASFDPRLAGTPGLDRLADSPALILNIDYPLGLAAYNILSEVAEHVGSVAGVYVLGKAASLNAVVGDVMIPDVVHDEHSQNTYLFNNCFDAADVAPYLVYGSVLDNQKAVTVRGTFLQNAQFMDVFYREGYTDIEMEAGPYLSAVYEMFRPSRHPVNEIVNLSGLPFDLGFLHYASDTPLNKTRNLGAGNLSYYGMDSTYAATLAIFQRILSVV